jgi:aryl-alcohol dehydrogenase-like predicted oxidoreductase
LKNLNINCLYGLLLHDTILLSSWKKEYSLAIEDLIKHNKIKYFGVSIYTDKDFELAINNPYINFIQIPFNIFDQRAISKKWFQKAKDKNKLIFIRSIFLQGLLLMDINKLPKNLELAKQYLLKFDLLCKKSNLSKSELALNFVDSIAKDAILLFGCDNIIQAKNNITNYNNLQPLNIEIIQYITNTFGDISENIYNPTKWKM